MSHVTRPPAGTVLPVLGLLSAFFASDAAGLERLQRRLDLERGLPFSEVYEVRQDARGFIWLATSGGLFRYDGVDLRPWTRGSLRPYDYGLTTGPAGEVMFRGYAGYLYEVSGQAIKPVEGPRGSPLKAIYPPVWDRQANLWVATSDGLWFRPPRGDWREWSLGRLGSERLRLLRMGEDGSPVILTSKGIWRIDGRLDATRLARMEGVQNVLVRDDGSIVMMIRRNGRVLELRDATIRELYRSPSRPIDMIQRGRTIWVSYDTHLVALTPGHPPEILGLPENVPSGGPLLVDREGSLWMATFRGLVQYPEPETVAWSVRDGMASNGTRRLALSPEGIWVDSWFGLSLLRRQGEWWRVERVPNTLTSAVCVGTDGKLWAGYSGRFLERRAGRFVAHALSDLRENFDCHAGAEGRVWLLSNLGLAIAQDAGAHFPPRLVPGPPGLHQEYLERRVLEDSKGRLWVTVGDEICRAEARDVAAGRPVTWACSKAEGAGTIVSLAEPSPGTLWAATVLGGVYRFAPPDRWKPMPGSRMLPTPWVRRLRPSPSGGVWIISFGTILRAVERPGSADGWEIVERPSPWHGLMISDAEDVLEEASGDLWITTLAGVVHIPPEVRRAVPPVPSVELVDVLVDGQPVRWQQGLDLPYHRNRVELRFAALSYRDPGLLRYQVRLRPDAPWTGASGRPSFQFVDLPPGKYHAEVRASLDGRRWSPSTAGLSFRVEPPLWRTWWFMSLAVLVGVSLAYALYRYRLTQLLRLERMRTRIAADLHDDIGASLSRIAIQSELLRRPDMLTPPDAERLHADIGDASRTLVDSMSDIVWSIDPKRDDLGSLCARVRHFALGMFEPQGVRLAMSVPDGAERVRLAPEPRRHLYLLLKEAVNNIARHAGCRNAAITLRVEGGRLSVEVRDDGQGFDGATLSSTVSSPRGGHGLPSMKARAELLGDTLNVTSAPGAGTTLRLSCPLERLGA